MDQYSIEVLDSDITIKNFREIDQLAFVFNFTNFSTLISRSGHAKILRDRDKSEYEGGWLMPRKRKILYYSGTLGSIEDSDDQTGIKEAIEKHFRVYLRK